MTNSVPIHHSSSPPSNTSKQGQGPHWHPMKLGSFQKSLHGKKSQGWNILGCYLRWTDSYPRGLCVGNSWSQWRVQREASEFSSSVYPGPCQWFIEVQDWNEEVDPWVYPLPSESHRACSTGSCLFFTQLSNSGIYLPKWPCLVMMNY